MEIQIAENFIDAGRRPDGLALLEEARAGSRNERPATQLTLLRRIANARLKADDRAGALQVADEMLALARRPALFPAAELADAAAAYNDLGGRPQAADILREALGKLPAPDRVIGVGPTVGPITGSTLGVGDSIRSTIAVELYRAGKRDEFENLVGKMTAWYYAHTWLRLYEEARTHGELEPSDKEVLRALPADRQLTFINIAATEALLKGDPERAKQLTASALALSDRTGDNVGPMVVTALVAFASGTPEQVTAALDIAAHTARKISDPGRRAFGLALVAAWKMELLSD